MSDDAYDDEVRRIGNEDFARFRQGFRAANKPHIFISGTINCKVSVQPTQHLFDVDELRLEKHPQFANMTDRELTEFFSEQKRRMAAQEIVYQRVKTLYGFRTTSAVLAKRRRGRSPPTLQGLSGVVAWVPFPALKKLLKTFVAEQAHDVIAARRGQKPGLAKWLEVWTWVLVGWYVLRAPLEAVVAYWHGKVGTSK